MIDVVGLATPRVHGARVKSAAIRIPVDNNKSVEFIISARTFDQLNAAVGRMLDSKAFELNGEHVRNSVLVLEGDLVIDDEL